ncbi:bifunctional riboflavin kinase/FAD synthetase [Pseudomethylobacillus aquaticus]|uniref:Riboflavin biosynthesis protein n=1 Tax=Pseudomethylobacillus aquaticus TaxID=2676064 RepID=A0A3N0V3M4_9PROT|nr:bifunctional riboflavin kinase/FAD synthetase [Pseudomethylobacillus aquaticus]ROH87182.1 bifunctional riboflavin kinase/FAD synthetase [Pseudomethylobacillus aquaticus]
MQIFRHFHQADGSPLALAIGNFDGMHLGHQALLQKLVTTARAQQLRAAVMTFEPHPREFFTPQQAPSRLASLREKLEYMAEAGVEYVYVCRFDRRFASLSAEQFMQMLRVSLNAQAILVGEDFRFGARRSGSVTDFAEAGFSLLSLPDVLVGEERVSSTAVREALAAGDLAHAATLLGRPYTISGKVVHGDKIGRQLGYPTANVHMRHDRPPLFGIYAVKLEGAVKSEGLGSKLLPGVASLGVRPTVTDRGKPKLEVHLFDFNGDLYGRHVRVHFMHKIRDEMKFADLDTLIQWIRADESAARAYFQG